MKKPWTWITPSMALLNLGDFTTSITLGTEQLQCFLHPPLTHCGIPSLKYIYIPCPLFQPHPSMNYFQNQTSLTGNKKICIMY